MTNGKCIYRNTVDYMSWMALEKTILEGFQRSGNFVGRGARCIKVGNGL